MTNSPNQSRGREPADLRCHRACARCSDLHAFSLIEMMIAIVILGLGLVMVATMFPVAWDRARTLSEYTIEQSAASAAEATIAAVARPVGVRLKDDDGNTLTEATPFIDSGSFAGDLFFDAQLARGLITGGAPADAHQGVLYFSDTRVHALHMENLLAENGNAVGEQPWRLEGFNNNILLEQHPRLAAAFPTYSTDEFRLRTSFYFPQVRAAQRMFAPLEGRPSATQTAEVDRWKDRLSSRRFCWAVLHRLREPIGPPCETQTEPACLMPLIKDPVHPLCGPRNVGAPPNKFTPDESKCIASMAAQDAGSTRNFDVYYVTLRRGQPTHRFAQQDWTTIPDPVDLDQGSASVAALGSNQDVVLPVPWRVQVQLPTTLAYRAAGQQTGVPTEITVPHSDITNGATAAMIVSMFPPGTQFVDEITGLVLRVAKRRILLGTGGNQSAVLTLDREILQEDIDVRANDRRVKCGTCTDSNPTAPAPDPEELRRTVWVFPPAVDRSSGGQDVIFDGPSPVVGIEVRTLSVAPQ